MRNTAYMSAPDEARRNVQAWSSPVGLVALAWVLSVAALAWTVFATDPGGRILTGLAFVGLLLFALFGTVARPRLAATAKGVEIRRLLGRENWTWGSLRITVTATRRFGRKVSMLELESRPTDANEDGTLIVLGWLDLGTEPEQVAAALRAYRT